MNQIKWRQKALRQLRKIKQANIREKIYDAVDALKDFPNCPNVKKIKTTEIYRLRVGDWRVIFTPTLEVIFIEEVKRRNEQTYSRTDH